MGAWMSRLLHGVGFVYLAGLNIRKSLPLPRHLLALL
jgi:hypothetical protein